MTSTRFAKALATIALFNGMLFVCVREDLIAADKRAEAKRYLDDLRTGKTAKTKVTALQELGKLAALQKSLAADALPDIYKALEDKDASVRAAAASAWASAMSRSIKPSRPSWRCSRTTRKMSGCESARPRVWRQWVPTQRKASTLRMLAKGKDKKSNLVKAAKQATKAIAGKK